MIQTLIHHPAACLLAFLSLVALTFIANRLGLIAWLAWLGRHGGDRHEQDRRKQRRREEKRQGEATKEYWRVHQ